MNAHSRSHEHAVVSVTDHQVKRDIFQKKKYGRVFVLVSLEGSGGAASSAGRMKAATWTDQATCAEILDAMCAGTRTRTRSEALLASSISVCRHFTYTVTIVSNINVYV